MENLPVYISISLVLTTGLTVFLFYKATNHSKPSLIVVFLWLSVQAVLSLNGFYTVTDQMPPRFLLLIGPPLVLIVTLFFTTLGKQYLDNLNLRQLTLLHIIRVPVELVLLLLFLYKVVPELMTFEGRNFDIFSGLSAPLIYYFGFVKNQLSRKIILLWNFICLGLLLNIVIHAFLSAPLPFQRLAFEQPNIAVLYFPFVWLPSCIVPLVLLSHLATIRQLLMRKGNTTANNIWPEAGRGKPVEATEVIEHS